MRNEATIYSIVVIMSGELLFTFLRFKFEYILYFQIWMRLLIETVDENWHFYFSKKLSFTLNCYNKCSNRSAYMRHMRIQVINKKKFRILYISIFKLKPIYALLLLFITHRKKVWCYEWKYTHEKYPITKFNGISIELHTA